jgi:hypothetical protein
MGGTPRITRVLLTAEETTVMQRLRGREIGSQLGPHLARSAKMTDYLESTAPASVLRIRTDQRTVADVAHDLIAATGWATQATYRGSRNTVTLWS